MVAELEAKNPPPLPLEALLPVKVVFVMVAEL